MNPLRLTNVDKPTAIFDENNFNSNLSFVTSEHPIYFSVLKNTSVGLFIRAKKSGKFR